MLALLHFNGLTIGIDMYEMSMTRFNS